MDSNSSTQYCSTMIGSINDAGILNGLKRKGFTPEKCISELYANSIDADAKKILYAVSPLYIKMIDDGKGMNYAAVLNMFDIHKENHKGEKSLGVSGVGSKVATLILSDQTEVKVFTKTVDGPYYVITIPWAEMFIQSKYTGMIISTMMNAEEISEFHKERENMTNKNSGVTIRFKYSDNLKTEIEKQFCSPTEYQSKYCTEIDPENKLSVIYGGFDIDVNYSHFEEVEMRVMNKYNYFGEENNEYYKGKTTQTIQVYENTKKEVKFRYIWDKNGDQYEIKPFSKGFKTQAEMMTESLKGWNHIGDYYVVVGCRRDDSYFNEKSLIVPSGAMDVPLEYDNRHLGNIKTEYLFKPQLVRNGQIICAFELPDVLISNRRANAKSMFQIRHVKCNLLYNPVSSLNNKQDLQCGIQENKNQCACILETPLSRLIQIIKDEKSNEIWNYFEETATNNQQTESNTLKLVRLANENRIREEKETKDKARRLKQQEKIEKKLAAAKEAERLAQLQAEQLAQKETERIAQLEAEQLAQLETERIAQQEAERIAQLNETPEKQAEFAKNAQIERERREQLEMAERERREQIEMAERERLIKEHDANREFMSKFITSLKEYNEEDLLTLKMDKLNNNSAYREKIINSAKMLLEFLLD